MAASGGTILKGYAEEIEKITQRHEHALGYAPGMDNLEMDDWSKLNDFLKEMHKVYSGLARKYQHQVGLTSSEIAEIHTKCYKKVGHGEDFLGCVRQEAIMLQSQKS